MAVPPLHGMARARRPTPCDGSLTGPRTVQHTQSFGSRTPKPGTWSASEVSGWTFRKGGLNTSLPRCVHPPPIKPVFYGSPTMPRLDAGFTLRCFQRLSLTAWLPSGALSDNW